MKLQAKKKEIKNFFKDNLFSVGYYKAQFLLKGAQPFAYSAGIYGWNCDYYAIDGICISTGYRPIGQDAPYNLVEKYENLAKNANPENRSEILKKFVEELKTLK